jgi:hypothetical protein
VPEPAGGDAPDEIFHREWVRRLWTLGLQRAKERLEQSGRATAFMLLSRIDVEPAEGAPKPSYAQLAEETGLSVTQVTNHLAGARRELRSCLSALLRELTATDEEYRSEARALFGDRA